MLCLLCCAYGILPHACSGSLKSAVDHRLSAESVVVLDSLNYIKGFRYELYCSTRTFLRTVWCG